MVVGWCIAGRSSEQVVAGEVKACARCIGHATTAAASNLRLCLLLNFRPP